MKTAELKTFQACIESCYLPIVTMSAQSLIERASVRTARFLAIKEDDFELVQIAVNLVAACHVTGTRIPNEVEVKVLFEFRSSYPNMFASLSAHLLGFTYEKGWKKQSQHLRCATRTALALLVMRYGSVPMALAMSESTKESQKHELE